MAMPEKRMLLPPSSMQWVEPPSESLDANSMNRNRAAGLYLTPIWARSSTEYAPAVEAIQRVAHGDAGTQAIGKTFFSALFYMAFIHSQALTRLVHFWMAARSTQTGGAWKPALETDGAAFGAMAVTD